MAEDKHSGSEADGRGQAHAAAEANSRSDAERAQGRRRFLTGGLIGAPIIVTLSSRPAWATYCSPSAMHSGNLSRVNTVECRGLTPGYWGRHTDWPSGVEPGPCNPITDGPGICQDYSVPSEDELKEALEEANGWKKWKIKRYLRDLEDYPASPPFGTQISTLFGIQTEPSDLTMMQALWPDSVQGGSGGIDSVLAHIVAAYLNALEFGKEAYGLSPDEVIQMVQARYDTDPIGLKDDLVMLNERG